MDTEQFNIVYKEVTSHSRTIKEAMFIYMHDPTLNRNLGKYQLPRIWDHLLQVSPTLQCKPSNYTHPYLTSPPSTGSPLTCIPPALHIGGRGTYFSMVSTHVCPKHTPNTPHTKSTTSPTAVSSW